MRAIFTKLVKDETGVTAIEYGMIAALIAVVIIAVVTGLGSQISSVFTAVSTSI
jgi:pilus assembly protein Flp/PilA